MTNTCTQIIDSYVIYIAVVKDEVAIYIYIVFNNIILSFIAGIELQL